jgi:PIN domain
VGIYFFDTSALQHRYMDGPESRTVRRIISDPRVICHIADWTVVEMASTLARRCRQAALSNREFDSLERQFFEDIATGRLRVRNTTSRDFTRARDLLRYAGIIKRRRLGSGDALIAACCLDMAYQEKCRVTFCTSDKPLHSILSDITAFTSALHLRFFQPPIVAVTHGNRS